MKVMLEPCISYQTTPEMEMFLKYPLWTCRTYALIYILTRVFDYGHKQVILFRDLTEADHFKQR